MAQYRLSPEQRIEIVNRYLNGENGTILAEKFGITSQSVYSLLKNRNIQRRRKTYQCNEEYFDCINSSDKAYWLGFFYADGTMYRNTWEFHIGKEDKQHLYLLRDCLSSNHPICDTKSGCRIRIHSSHICEQMKKYKLQSPKSSNLEYPHWLGNNLQSHFIRGFYDGDGWISIAKRHIKNSLCVGFASCSKSFLLSIQDYFCKEIGEKRGSIICRKRSHIPNQKDNFRLHFGGNISCNKILNIIYKDTDNSLFLERKFFTWKKSQL